MLNLFDAPDELPDRCPLCGSAVRECFVDTGSPMRAVPTPNGPYVLDGTVLRFVSNDGHVLSQGSAEKRVRRTYRDEKRWASRFYECPRKAEWHAANTLPERQ